MLLDARNKQRSSLRPRWIRNIAPWAKSAAKMRALNFLLDKQEEAALIRKTLAALEDIKQGAPVYALEEMKEALGLAN